MQYLYEENGEVYGDPFMTTVQSVTQFRNSYKLLTEEISKIHRAPVNRNVTIAVTLRKTYTNQLLIQNKDKQIIKPAIIAVKQVEDYQVLLIHISYDEFYTIKHVDNKAFGLLLYGLPHKFLGYGYPVAMSFSSSVDTSDGDIWCLDCIDMSHLKYCDKVKKCSTNDQVCFVQSYTRSLDVQLYSSGCIDRKSCNFHGQPGCLTCCSGSFCNTQGCGDNGIHGIQNRGPMCFDCNHRGEQDSCRTLQLCAPDEVCIVEKYSWGADDFHYVQGCSRACGLSKKYTRDANEIQTRHVPICTHCCSSDFCNINCTETAIPAIIG